MWPLLRNFHIDVAESTEEMRTELSLFKIYMERQWIRKVDTGNLYSFNRLGRTRNTNPAESFHSLIIKFVQIFFFQSFTVCLLLYRDPGAVMKTTIINFVFFLQRISSEADSRMRSLTYQSVKPRPRNKKYVQIENRIMQALDEFEVVNFIFVSYVIPIFSCGLIKIKTIQTSITILSHRRFLLLINWAIYCQISLIRDNQLKRRREKRLY